MTTTTLPTDIAPGRLSGKAAEAVRNIQAITGLSATAVIRLGVTKLGAELRDTGKIVVHETDGADGKSTEQ